MTNKQNNTNSLLCFQLRQPWQTLFWTIPRSTGNPKLVNTAVLKANTVMYHFQPFLFPDIENLLHYQSKTYPFCYFLGKWLLASCCIFITVSELHNLMDFWWSKINSFKFRVWTLSFFATSNNQNKVFPVSKPTIKKIIFFSIKCRKIWRYFGIKCWKWSWRMKPMEEDTKLKHFSIEEVHLYT